MRSHAAAILVLETLVGETNASEPLRLKSPHRRKSVLGSEERRRDETRCLPIEEEIIDEDFYEKIEAPKFVDLTAPDKRRPDDDRHWFCLRVGCDQKHEEELDSEAIYKNFVLRVMAARSPNVRLRKALNRREASENLKCPQTAPAKPRVSRMAFISSLSHKVTDNNVRAKPLSKVAAKTPNAKVKQPPSVAKALTTPRNQNKASNQEQFRSVQSKKAMTVAVPKSRVVAKTLVFHSPKKVVVKTKSSVELKTAMKTLCSAMKKLEFNGVKKNGEGSCSNNSLQVAASRKQFKGREEKKVKAMQKRQVTVPHENDSSDMEIDERSRSESLERWPESQEPTRGESSVLALSEASRDHITSLSGSNGEERETTEGSENEEPRNTVSDKGKVPEAKKRKAEGNSMAFDDKENEIQLTESDDKENDSAPSENIRAMSINNDEPKKAILGNKQEDRKTHKKSTSTSAGSHVVKYRKLKPTNPKPFKFRTDERGILKEANLEKKIPSPLKDTTAKDSKAIRKHQNKNETCLAHSEQDNYSSCDEKSNQSGNIQSDKSNSKVQRKLSATTPHRNTDPKLQKPIDMDENFKRKSKMMQRNVARPRSALSRKKGNACKLSVIIENPSVIVKPKEATKPRKHDASSPTNKARSSSRPCSQGRRALTVPKEPKFQSLHVPKSCTTRKPT